MNRRNPSSMARTSNGAMASLPVWCAARTGHRRRHNHNTSSVTRAIVGELGDEMSVEGAKSRLSGMAMWGLSGQTQKQGGKTKGESASSEMRAGGDGKQKERRSR